MTTIIPRSEQNGARIAAEVACPNCRERGTKVQRVTLESLLRPERRGDIGDKPHYVCATPRCDTVYFRERPGKTFRKSDLTVRFGLKEIDAPRLVCYCFDHTIEEIHDEIHRTGGSTIVDSIRAEMKEPGCRCEYTNPAGDCCLGAVQAALANALRSIVSEGPAETAGAADHGGCCEGTGQAPNEPDKPVDPDRVIEAVKTAGSSATSAPDAPGPASAGQPIVNIRERDE